MTVSIQVESVIKVWALYLCSTRKSPVSPAAIQECYSDALHSTLYAAVQTPEILKTETQNASKHYKQVQSVSDTW